LLASHLTDAGRAAQPPGLAKSGSDNVAFYLLYGTTGSPVYGSSGPAWYREEGLWESEDQSGACSEPGSHCCQIANKRRTRLGAQPRRVSVRTPRFGRGLLFCQLKVVLSSY